MLIAGAQPAAQVANGGVNGDANTLPAPAAIS